MPSFSEQKLRVRDQFARAGAAYVSSLTHASGADLSRMVDVATPRPSERVLDIATGGGHVARAFAPLVRAVAAVDLTPTMLRVALDYLRSAGVGNVTGIIADAEALPVASSTIDIVTCRIAPHHFPSPRRFVEEVARVLVPNGRFVLIDSTVPAGDVGEFFNEFERLRDASHVRSLTVEEWSSLITEAGLALRLVEHFPKTHSFDDWTARMHVPEKTKAILAERMRYAPHAVADVYHPVWDGDRLVSFTDTKTLFLAERLPA